MEDLKRNQVEILELKNNIIKMKNSMVRFNCRRDLAEERSENQAIRNYPERSTKCQKT